ncbi:MAG TPA: flagellar basal-body MS-ring/collar protein FliF [Alphaproteobacteria bacterium]|nr:flagellar basal-body MS-ring/collar protein FliF [Alphaproteobacteria bacterium]
MNGFLGFLRSLGVGRIIALGVVAAGLLGFFFYLTVRITTPPMSLLYSGLDASDSGAVVSQLEGMNVPYKLVGDGTSIMVPEDRVLRLRMSMAQKGLPSGGAVGYEIFDKGNSLGTTSFEQKINQLRALEGELARTIRSLNPIAAARVHLVLPQRELFSRDERKPSASITLRTRGTLSPSEVSAIQHLVASAVPDLKPNEISIIDQNSTLLAAGDGTPTGDAATTNQMADRRNAYEDKVKGEIEKLIGSVVGPGHVRAEVSADLNFDRSTVNAETYDPDSQVVSSSETTTSQSNSNEKSGSSQDVSVSSNIPGGNNTPASTDKAGRSSSDKKSTESVVYSISKTVKNEIHEAGAVKRLSVAVLVDGTYVKGTDGKETYKPRSAAELKQIDALVRSAIGFDAKRGDSVQVTNLQFNKPDIPELNASSPGLFDFSNLDIVRLIELGVLAVISLLVIFLVVRPLIRGILNSAAQANQNGMGGTPQLAGAGAQGTPALAAPHAMQHAPPQQIAYQTAQQQPTTILSPAAAEGQAVAMQLSAQNQAQPQAQGDPASIEAMIDIANVEGRVKESALKKVGTLVDRHPDEAVAVMRNWLYSD